MAKKKGSQQQKSSKEEAVAATTTTTQKTMEDSSEKVPSSKEVSVDKPLEMKEDQSEKLANLKSLNKLLVKETVEKREQVDSLMKSKESLEKEIDRFKEENERLVMEKKVLEEKAEEVDSLSEEIKKQKMLEEELRGEVEEKVRELSEVKKEFSGYQDRVGKDLDLKEKDGDRLRSLVKDLEKSNGEAVKEIERLKIEKDGVVEEKAGMEIEAGNLKKEMEDAVRERDELEHSKRERDIEIKKLQWALDLLNVDLERQTASFEEILSQKSEIQKFLDIAVKESEVMKSKIRELELNSASNLEKNLEQTKEIEKLVAEKTEMKSALETLMTDNVSLQESLEGSKKSVENLNREIREMVDGIDEERTKNMTTITDLQKDVEKFRTNISTLKKENEDLQSKVAEIGKSCDEALEKAEMMQSKLDVVVEEKEEKERDYEVLVDEKESVISDLKEASEQLIGQSRKLEEIGSKKAEIEQALITRNMEIEELRKEMGNLRVSESELEEASRKQIEEINKLQSEIVNYRLSLEKVTLERDDVQKEFDLKKRDEASLKLQVQNLEKSIEEGSIELEQLKKERDSLLVEKKEMGTQNQLLLEEKASLQKSLMKAEEDNRGLLGRTKSSEIYSEKALLMLRNASQMVCGSEEDSKKNGEIGESKTNAVEIEEEIQPFASELGSMKRAFKIKEKKLEELTQQIETLTNSVMEAQKRKNFWTWLSSATTVFAAASVAYVAKGR